MSDSLDLKTLDWPDKHPTERFWVGADWEVMLAGDTIASCNATVEQGDVIVPSNNFDGMIQRVRIEGGTEGAQIVRCDIVTSDAREFVQKYRFNVIP